MVMDESSSLMRWGLRLLDGDYHSEYYDGINHHDTDIYHEQQLNGFYGMGSSNIENDEIIARTLQEEWSDLAVAESRESSFPEKHSESNIANEWPNPSLTHPYSDHESVQDELNDLRPPTSCSSPEVSYDGDDYSYPLELTDEHVFDGEVGKRLDQMTPIPHIPRINGDIPSYDEATSDHQRLLDRADFEKKREIGLMNFNSVIVGASPLGAYGLVELKVEGDGNCQFRALSDQFYRTPEHHGFVRRQIVNQLKLHPELYEGYVPMGYSEYLKKMSKSGEWGDHVTLQAAADKYGVRISVITSFKDRCKIEILPKVHNSERVIFLSFWAEVHYNSIYPQEVSSLTWSSPDFDLPSSDDLKKKKRWWNFGNKH